MRPPPAGHSRPWQLADALRRDGRLTESSVVNVKNRFHAVTAQIVMPDGAPATGVLIAQGGTFGGWSLYLIAGRPTYCYNLFGMRRFKVAGSTVLPPGPHQVRMEFTYDGGGPAKGGSVALYVNGDEVGSGRVDATEPLVFSTDETTDLGCDSATPVSDDYTSATSRFTGRIDWVRIDLGEDAADADHYITPEERLRFSMARQ